MIDFWFFFLGCEQQGVCYAFVEFEDSSSAQSTIEASPVQIGGRSAYIEEKKAMGRGWLSRSNRFLVQYIILL